MFLYINFDSWTSRKRVRWTTTKTKKSIHFDSNFYYSCRRKLWLCNYIISFNMFRWTYTISTFSKEHDKYCTHIALNFHSLSFQMYRASDPPIIPLKHGGLSDRLEFIVYDFPSFYVLAIKRDSKEQKKSNCSWWWLLRFWKPYHKFWKKIERTLVRDIL